MIDVFTPEKSEGIMIVMSGAPQEELWNDEKMWIDKKMRNECWKGYQSLTLHLDNLSNYQGVFVNVNYELNCEMKNVIVAELCSVIEKKCIKIYGSMFENRGWEMKGDCEMRKRFGE